MAHLVLIILHTAGASVALVTGGVVIRPWIFRDHGRRLFPFFLWPLVGMVVFVIAVLSVDWTSLSWAERGIFLALTFLDLFMIWRAYRARRVRERGRSGWLRSYVDHVGFVLISLFAGFVIVLAIDLKAPVWAVAVVAVVAIVAGQQIVHRIEKRTEQTSLQGPSQ